MKNNEMFEDVEKSPKIIRYIIIGFVFLVLAYSTIATINGYYTYNEQNELENFRILKTALIVVVIILNLALYISLNENGIMSLSKMRLQRRVVTGTLVIPIVFGMNILFTIRNDGNYIIFLNIAYYYLFYCVCLECFCFNNQIGKKYVKEYENIRIKNMSNLGMTLLLVLFLIGDYAFNLHSIIVLSIGIAVLILIRIILMKLSIQYGFSDNLNEEDYK